MLLARRGFGLLLPLRLSATAARMRSFKAASSTLSPSWMSMARHHLTFSPWSSRVIEDFKVRLGKFVLFKNCFQIPVDWEIDRELVSEGFGPGQTSRAGLRISLADPR